jgi:hypothetical protein
MYLYRSLFIVVLIVVGAFAQSSSNPSTPDQKHTVRVGVAATENRSSRQIIPTWERDQLVRELQRLRINRKSEIVLEVVSLDATAREDASSEAEQKSCRYFVLTTLLNPSRGPAISGGPDGSQRAPVLIGNTNPNQTVAVNFTVVEVGTARTVAEGTTTAPVESASDTRAADEVMRVIARRVADELRNRPPIFD